MDKNDSWLFWSKCLKGKSLAPNRINLIHKYNLEQNLFALLSRRWSRTASRVTEIWHECGLVYVIMWVFLSGKLQSCLNISRCRKQGNSVLSHFANKKQWSRNDLDFFCVPDQNFMDFFLFWLSVCVVVVHLRSWNGCRSCNKNFGHFLHHIGVHISPPWQLGEMKDFVFERIPVCGTQSQNF